MSKIALLSMLTCATLVGNEITLNEKDFQQCKNISNCVWDNNSLPKIYTNLYNSIKN